MSKKTEAGVDAVQEVARVKGALCRTIDHLVDSMGEVRIIATKMTYIEAALDGDWHEELAEIMELQQDKARLDFLAEQAPVDRWKVRYEDEGGGVWTLHSFSTHGMVTLREAIDKAMRLEKIDRAMKQEDDAQAGSLDSG